MLNIENTASTSLNSENLDVKNPKITKEIVENPNLKIIQYLNQVKTQKENSSNKENLKISNPIESNNSSIIRNNSFKTINKDLFIKNIGSFETNEINRNSPIEKGSNKY